MGFARRVDRVPLSVAFEPKGDTQVRISVVSLATPASLWTQEVLGGVLIAGGIVLARRRGRSLDPELVEQHAE
jgi:hypothetical protein